MSHEYFFVVIKTNAKLDKVTVNVRIDRDVGIEVGIYMKLNAFIFSWESAMADVLQGCSLLLLSLLTRMLIWTLFW
jgi:hypothetical protein